MRKPWLGLLAVAGLAAMTAMPLSARADGMRVRAGVNVGGEDENVHFDFKSGPRHYHPKIWRAANQLREARRTLWGAAKDFGGHRLKAIAAIDAALDELRAAVETANSR